MMAIAQVPGPWVITEGVVRPRQRLHVRAEIAVGGRGHRGLQ